MPISPAHGCGPYSIALVGEDEAEINMYGEVIKTRPVDFWTGEPVPGEYIVQDEFIRELEDLKEKRTITIHIHSVGGDAGAGLAIYNRLKNLEAKITTINDGLAASAGSVIFMAGEERRVNPGSILMVHQASMGICGMCNIPELKAHIKMLDAYNRAMINAYAERTGRDPGEIKGLVDRETWMTGQEAVDNGFATELIEADEDTDPISMMMSPDRATMMVNGVAVAACCLGNIPDSIPTMSDEEWAEITAPIESVQPAPQDRANTSTNGGTNDMEEIKTMEQLKSAFPDLVAQMETAAKAAGLSEERARIQGIEEIEAAIQDKALVAEAKYGETPMNAEQLAFAAMKRQAALGRVALKAMEEDNKESGVENVEPGSAPDEGNENEDEDKQAENLLLKAVQKRKEC